MAKYAVYDIAVHEKRQSDFFKTAEEAVEEMNAHYPSRTKVLEITKKGRTVVAYHKHCYA